VVTPTAPPDGVGQPKRKHRRIAYRVEIRPFRHGRDTDLIEGFYRDREGRTIGQLLLADQQHEPPKVFLVIPDESLPLVHVEASLDADRRVSIYEQVFGLLYEPNEETAPGVRENGDRWEAGDLVVYTFETDEDALTAQEYPIGG